MNLRPYLMMARTAKRLGMFDTVVAIKQDLLRAFDREIESGKQSCVFRDVTYPYPSDKAIDLYRNGNKLDGVKEYRLHGGCDNLMAAKVIMEAVGHHLGFAPYETSYKQVEFK